MHATTMPIYGSPTQREAFKPAVRQVGLVVCDGFSLLDVGMVFEVFRILKETGQAAQGDGRADGVTYRVQLLSEDGGSVTSSGAAKIRTSAVGDYVCECGRTLLVADSFAHEPYELVRGALAIVSRKFGEAVSREIAGQLLPGAGDQLLPVTGDIDAVKYKVRKGAQWLAENCARPITIEDAAAQVAMSRRNFLRMFKLEIGSTPSEFLLKTRLGMAGRLLAQTGLPVDKIARRCALGNGDNLAKIFRRKWSISPTEYRSRQRREECTSAEVSELYGGTDVIPGMMSM